MSNILFFHIGKKDLLQADNNPEGLHTFYHYYDKEICPFLPSDDNNFLIDYSDLEELRTNITGLLPISQVFIITEMTGGLGSLVQMKEIMTKVLLVLKSVTFPLMQQRNGKVWLIYNQGQNMEEMALDLGIGLKTLIQVFAVEMSKKSIVANFILSDSYVDRIVDIILLGESCSPFNFTSQQLILKERN